MMSGTSLIITSSAIVGYILADDKSLATIPLALQFVATMLTSIPAALLMSNIGRKKGFIFATFFGFIGASISTVAIINSSFWWFTVGVILVGVFNGFANYYRFTAADSVTIENKSKAISLVLAGGVLAAFIGPNLANLSKDLISSASFAGSYASLSVLYILSFITLNFLNLPKLAVTEFDSGIKARSLKIIAMQPKFITAIICGMLGYAVMSFIMTATPLAMKHHQHDFSDTSFVIQWHVLAMFAPSFFTGHLIKRYSVENIMLIGALLATCCVIINLYGTSITHFWFALLLLGVSWNFLFVGATSLLTETYHQIERAKVQASNDFIVFTSVAIASLSAGGIQHYFGWRSVNIGVLPVISLIFISIIWLKWKTPESVKKLNT